MKSVIKNILLYLVWFIVGLYVLIAILLHIPAVQGWAGSLVEDALSEKLGTKVFVERVDLGFLNRIIVDGFVVYDQRNKRLLSTTRLSARVDPVDLLEGKISISSAQIFGMKANLYKDNADSPLNCQFIIDSLASKDTTKSSPINLRIASLVIRNGQLKYNQNDIAYRPESFSPRHIFIDKISSHLMIYAIMKDSIDVAIKHLSFEEQSGTKLKDLSLSFLATDKKAELNDFNLETQNSKISLYPIKATYKMRVDSIDLHSLAFSGKTKVVSIHPQDIQPFVKANVSNMPTINIHFSADGTLERVSGAIAVNSSDKDIALNTNYVLRNLLDNNQSDLQWSLSNLRLNLCEGIIAKTNSLQKLPDVLNKVGTISIKGNAQGTLKTAKGDITLNTSKAGNAKINGSYNGRDIDAHILASALDLNAITGSSELGTLDGKVDGKVTMENGNLEEVNAQVSINNLFAHGYEYQNINSTIAYKSQGNKVSLTDLKFNSNDPNLVCNIDGKVDFTNGKPSRINANINMEKIVPNALGLTNEWGNSIFAFNSNVNAQGADINNITGNLNIDDFTIFGGHKSLKNITTGDAYTIDNFNIKVAKEGNGMKHLSVESDFLNAEITGTFVPTTIASSFIRLIGHYLSYIPGLKIPAETNNNFSISATISSTEFLHRLLGVDIEMEGNAQIRGYINDATGHSNIYCTLPKLDLGTQNINDLQFLLWTPDNSLNTSISATVGKEGKAPFKIEFNGKAEDDVLKSTIQWENTKGKTFKGKVNTLANFLKQMDGKACVNINIDPSNIQLGDTIYKLRSNDITYSDKRLAISNFTIGNDNQHLYINGVASKDQNDSIIADLKDLNIAYIMNLINFHSVEFGGFATGKIIAKEVFDKPEAYAHLDVKDFLFEEGNLGTFSLNAVLNNEEEQIDVNGHTLDNKGGMLGVYGLVSPQRNCIDLDLVPENTNLGFLHSYCHTFMDDIDVRGTGRLRLYGPFSTINITGQIVADGAFTVTTLNTRYTFKKDTVNFVPDDMVLENQPMYDMYGHKALVSGGIHHKHLTKLTYDFNMKTDNFLCYDFKDFDGGVFYGTAFLSGECDMIGRSAELNINVNGNVEEGSKIVYNASSPDAISQQEFITWGSANDAYKRNLTQEDGNEKSGRKEERLKDVRTNIYMNFNVNITDKSLLRVIMDEASGDYIDLHGNADLQAKYYNKGSFEVFGNFNVQSGLYQMTIQKVIRRIFDFQQGGTITFGGDPFNAGLNLLAKYTVNSVPLSDLNLGGSFSNNNIRVDCLMNISGTAGGPKVDFDIDLPTVNTDVKQMINSLIASEDETNQQAIYLLSVGRFYAQSQNNATAEENSRESKTSQAMQGFLSGTLSQQLGNILGSFMNSSKWTVGANISPGNEGFNNAEYEGIFNGSLLSNRLLINGQFGYRDNATTSQQGFIGDFDIRYLLVPNGNLAVKVYNQTNDRYFTKNSLNTQGIGLIIKKDFNSWRELFGWKK